MYSSISIHNIDKIENSKRLFGWIFFITQFPSFITYHFKIYTRLAPSLFFHHSIIFILFVGPILVTWSEISCFVPAEDLSSPSFSLFSFPLPPLALSLSQSTNPNPTKIEDSANLLRHVVAASISHLLNLPSSRLDFS